MPNKIQDLFGQWIQFDCPTDGATFSIAVANRVWDVGTLTWVSQVQSSGGGGAITVANGADVTEGATTDAAVYGDTAGTISAKLRGIDALMQGIGTAIAPASASVISTDSVVIAANALRKKMVVINVGAVNVFFGDGFSSAMNSGIMLTPNGTWVMDRYTFTTNDIHAICASNSTLSIQEYQ
jgi:hypothetical protein